MAFAERAELIARLSLKDDFSRPLKGVESKLSGFGAAASRTGKAIGVALGAGLTVGGIALVGAVRGGLSSLAELESATTSVDAAIKQMGLTGQVTSGQIAQWASEIEKNVSSAFDDKKITQAATTLIRYGKVTTDNLRPALVVMTDLAAKTGDVDSAATLLAKALAAPEKAAGRLARQGIILTKAQQDQIAAMVKVNDIAGAQAVLLDAITKFTKGAAAASQGPYTRSLKTLHDVIEDAQRALAEGFLPVIEKVRDLLSTELAKPQTLANIREFGKGLASGLDSLVEIARKIPWGSIGDALKLGGAGAKIILDAFASMPPWVQTAIATGWGLNKLTGGALTGIIGQVASGLVKGVLGMNAGVVNINAGVVNGAGGVPGVPVGGAVKTGISTLGKVFLIGETIGLIAAVNEVRDNIAAGLTKQSTDIHDAVTNQINDSKTTNAQLMQSLAGVNQGIEALSHDPIGNALLGDQLSELQKMRAELIAAIQNRPDGMPGSANQREDRGWTQREHNHLYKALHQRTEEDRRHNRAYKSQGFDPLGPRALRLAADQHAALLRIRERADSNALTTKTAINDVRDESARAKIAAAGSAQQIQNATTSGTSQIVGAIARSRPTVNVSVRVSGMNVTVQKTYSQGDMGGGNTGGPGGPHAPGHGQ